MSATDGPATAPLPFGGVNPIFRVRSVVESMNYYVRVLGFKVDFHVPASGFASVSRGRCAIFLCEGDQGHFGGWVWIGVSDAARVFQEYAAKGAKVRHPPTNYEWAYEMQVEDPDGNVLRIGSEPKKGEPIGDWLDMLGDRWVRSATGEWTRVERP